MKKWARAENGSRRDRSELELAAHGTFNLGFGIVETAV